MNCYWENWSCVSKFIQIELDALISVSVSISDCAGNGCSERMEADVFWGRRLVQGFLNTINNVPVPLNRLSRVRVEVNHCTRQAITPGQIEGKRPR